MALPSEMRASGAPQEARRRLIGSLVILAFWYILYLGTSWDIQWHSDVGPDRFWTAPHSMMYAGVAVGGLASLYMVISTTLRYRRGAPGVTDATTTPWLGGRFHAPLGAIVSGFGALSFLLSGGFDEFWHALYGFDLTLWSPPHIALIFSALIGVIGALIGLASVANQVRAAGVLRLTHPSSLGVAAAGAVLLVLGALPLPPAMIEKPFLGPFSLYPLMAAAVLPLCLVAVASFLRLPGAATVTALFATGLRALVIQLSPVLVAMQARIEGLPYKPDAVGFSLTVMVVPALLILVGVVIDAVLWAGQRYRLPLALTMPGAGALSMVTLFLIDRPWVTYLDVLPWVVRFPSVHEPMLKGHMAAFVPTMAAVFAVGAAFAWVGWRFGIYLRYTDK